MIYLFTEEGSKAISALPLRDTLYAFDYDGTLSAIAGAPELAFTASETFKLIEELSLLVPTAVISGRSISDLTNKIKLHRGILIGNHGLEGLGLKQEDAKKIESICSEWQAQLSQVWKQANLCVGVFVEDKTYSLSLHYRKAQDRRIAKRTLLSMVKRLKPTPNVILGKCVINLVPSSGMYKGRALLETMKHLNLKNAFYIGDDDTDEDIFTLSSKEIVTVRVGKKMTSHAQYFLKRRNEVNRLIREIIDNVSAKN